jgi:hypothetical protein
VLRTRPGSGRVDPRDCRQDVRQDRSCYVPVLGPGEVPLAGQRAGMTGRHPPRLPSGPPIASILLTVFGGACRATCGMLWRSELGRRAGSTCWSTCRWGGPLPSVVLGDLSLALPLVLLHGDLGVVPAVGCWHERRTLRVPASGVPAGARLPVWQASGHGMPVGMPSARTARRCGCRFAAPVCHPGRTGKHRGCRGLHARPSPSSWGPPSRTVGGLAVTATR